MSAHLEEEDLILHRYREAEAPPDAAAHIAECEMCRGRLAELERTLELLSEEELPERGEDYGAQVYARIRSRLARGSRVLPFRLRPWLLPLAAAASLILAFWLGRVTHEPVPSPSPVAAREVVRERILLLAVGDHLDRSRMVLVELASAADDKRSVDISSEQERAQNLVANSRLYRQTAARAGEAKVVSVLDELERILVEVANGPSRLTPEELAEIRERIEDHGLLFRVKVLGSQVREREREVQKSGLVS